MIQDVLAELRTAGFRVVGVVQGVVVAERRVPGLPHHFRVCGAWPARDGWRARLRITQPDPDQVLGRIETQEQCGGPFADAEAFGWWLGHACSVPVSPVEVEAILATGSVAMSGGQRGAL